MKKTVVEVECSRCHRKEYLPASDKEEEMTPSVVITVCGVEVARFDDLCGPCTEAVMGHVGQIIKLMEKKSPNRKKKVGAMLEEMATENAGKGTLHNGSGAKKDEAQPAPRPVLVTRSPR
jgi:hypothetical protein